MKRLLSIPLLGALALTGCSGAQWADNSPYNDANLRDQPAHIVEYHECGGKYIRESNKNEIAFAEISEACNFDAYSAEQRKDIEDYQSKF